jgi:methionyl-tRNA formyltransferase
MRFAMACNDRYLSVFESFVSADWEPIKLFPDPHTANREAIAFAQRLGLAIQLSPITPADLEALGAAGCKALIVAEHGRLIPDWRPYMPHAVNFHPGPLPEARGGYPAVRAILEDRREWAVTCHRISERFDRGDILDQEPFPLTADETHESIDIKLQLAARRLSNRVAAGFDDLWRNARPQGKGSYWPLFTDADRVLDFSQPVDTVLRHIRAFGELETIAQVKGVTLHVRRATGWREAHSHEPATVVYRRHPAWVIAASDGYVCLHDWSIFPRAMAVHIGSHAGR